MKKNGKNGLIKTDNRILTAGVILIGGIIVQQAVKGIKKLNSWEFNFDMKF